MLNKKFFNRIFVNLIYLVLFWIFTDTSFTHAQSKPVRFDRFNTRDGLSQNKIFDILQDKFGFIWIGTEDGLNRYDGYEFKVYKNDPNDVSSLSSNMIEQSIITKLVPTEHGPKLQLTINEQNKRRYFDLVTHKEIIDYDERQAIWLARYYTGQQADVMSVSFVTEFSHE